MHLTAVNKIVITQQPDPTNKEWPNRHRAFTFNKIESFEAESSWAGLTDTAKVKFPKYFTVKDENGTVVNFGSAPGGAINNQSITANFGNMAPLFLRGDKITIYTGYGYFDANNNPVFSLNPVFDGYITAITNSTPIELQCQDTMYLFKQVQAPNQVWPAKTYSMEQMIQVLINLVNSKYNSNITLADNPTSISTNIGDFRTQNETVCQVLERLQKDYKIESFFRNDIDETGRNFPIFYCGLITYYPGVAVTQNFVFQKNIIAEKSQLNYTRLDDIKIGVHAYSVNKTELLTRTKSGRLKTKSKRLETFVGTAKANDGQIRTLYFWNINSLDALKAKAEESLRRFYYEGYRGKFATFALPHVRQGDIASISDNYIPERKGDYFIKKVTYTGGVEGNWQEIEIDLRIDGVFNSEQLALGI